MKFYLGTHRPSWLAREDVDVELFVSHRTLRERHPRTLPRARKPWALDSGGFTELNLRGADAFAEGPGPYVAAVRRYRDEVGLLEWAAPADWMCEPAVLARTGLDVAEHQRRTVANYLDLRDLAPDLPFVPVLQGWEADDYLRCLDLYAAAGVDLLAEPLVGVGTVCRRQDTTTGEAIFSRLAEFGLRLHGFGVKTTGLARYGDRLASADSLAWSYNARRNPPLPGCSHTSCNNCPRWALRWRERLLAASSAPTQLRLAL